MAEAEQKRILAEAEALRLGQQGILDNIERERLNAEKYLVSINALNVLLIAAKQMTTAARYSRLAREVIHRSFFIAPSPNERIRSLIEDINANMTVLHHDQTEVISPKFVKR